MVENNDAPTGNRCDQRDRHSRPGIKPERVGSRLVTLLSLLPLLVCPPVPFSHVFLTCFSFRFLHFLSFQAAGSTQFTPTVFQPLQIPEVASRLSLPSSNNVHLSFCRLRFLLLFLPRWPSCRFPSPNAHGGTSLACHFWF